MNKRNIALFLGLLALCIGFGSNSIQSSKHFADSETVYNFGHFDKKAQTDISVASETWQNKVFGHFQNNNEIKFEVTETSTKVTLDNITSASDTKKSCFTKLTSKTDSFGYYFKQIDPASDFTFTATMDFDEMHDIVIDGDVPYANFAAGIMVRDDICEDVSADDPQRSENYVKPYAAVGNFELPYTSTDKETGISTSRTTNIWYRDSDTSVSKKKTTTVEDSVPTVNNLIKGAQLKMEKTGGQYSLKYVHGDVTNSFTYTPTTTLNGSNLYVGLFISGPLKVSFSNITLDAVSVDPGDVENPYYDSYNFDLWNTSAFGAFYGSDTSKIDYSVTKKDNEVILEDGIDGATNYSRITGTADSFIMNYKKVNINEDFSFSAKMKINDINAPNESQVGCGIQVRDDVIDNDNLKDNYQKGYVSSMIAAGNFGLPYDDGKGNIRTNNAWYRDVTVKNDKSYLGGSNTTYIPQNDENGNVINNDEALLKIEKVGNEYTVTYICESQNIEKVSTQTLNLNNKDTDNVYVGVFISGSIKVTFTDVKLELFSNVEYVGYQNGSDNTSIRFLGKVYVGSDDDFTVLSQEYRAFDFTIYAKINDEYKFAKLETTGLMKKINNGSDTLTADEGWYYYGVIINDIPTNINFEVRGVKTSILAMEQGDL